MLAAEGEADVKSGVGLELPLYPHESDGMVTAAPEAPAGRTSTCALRGGGGWGKRGVGKGETCARRGWLQCPWAECGGEWGGVSTHQSGRPPGQRLRVLARQRRRLRCLLVHARLHGVQGEALRRRGWRAGCERGGERAGQRAVGARDEERRGARCKLRSAFQVAKTSTSASRSVPRPAAAA